MTSSYANKHIQPNERANKKDGLEEAARTRVAEMNLRPVYHDTLWGGKNKPGEIVLHTRVHMTISTVNLSMQNKYCFLQLLVFL